MLKKQGSFDFKMLEKINITKKDITKKEDILKVIIETILPQLSNIITVFCFIILLLKALDIPTTSLLYISNPEFSPLFILIAKLTFTSQAINQMLFYLKKKSLKSQFINGFLNLGLFYYLFQAGGIQNIFKLIYDIFSIIF